MKIQKRKKPTELFYNFRVGKVFINRIKHEILINLPTEKCFCMAKFTKTNLKDKD